MSQREEKISKLLEFPYDAFLMVRLEYVRILGDELEAKLLRIIEKYVEQERKNIYQKMLNTSGTPPPETVEIARDIWVPISYRLFMNDLFGTVTSENTVKKALKHMIDKRIIFHRFEPKKQYDAPEYKIHVNLLQMLLTLLKVAGYQSLIPSIFDTLKTLPPQELTPSECQKLIPSTENSSSNQNLRVSPNGTNIREGYDNNITSRTENNGAFAPPSSECEEEDAFSEEDEPPPTIKMPAIKLGRQTPLEQTPGIPAPLPLAVTPPGDRHGDAGSDQATPSLLLGPEPAQSSPPTGSVPSTRTVQASGEPKETAKQKKARLEQRKTEIIALYCELLGRKKIVLSKDNLEGAKLLAEAESSDAEITITYNAYKDHTFWGKQLHLKNIAKLLDTTVPRKSATTQKPEKAPGTSDFDIYKGNGPEEREQALRDYEERKANGTLIWQ